MNDDTEHAEKLDLEDHRCPSAGSHRYVAAMVVGLGKDWSSRKRSAHVLTSGGSAISRVFLPECAGVWIKSENRANTSIVLLSMVQQGTPASRCTSMCRVRVASRRLMGSQLSRDTHPHNQTHTRTCLSSWGDLSSFKGGRFNYACDWAPCISSSSARKQRFKLATWPTSGQFNGVAGELQDKQRLSVLESAWHLLSDVPALTIP